MKFLVLLSFQQRQLGAFKLPTWDRVGDDNGSMVHYCAGELVFLKYSAVVEVACGNFQPHLMIAVEDSRDL